MLPFLNVSQAMLIVTRFLPSAATSAFYVVAFLLAPTNAAADWLCDPNDPDFNEVCCDEYTREHQPEIYLFCPTDERKVEPKLPIDCREETIVWAGPLQRRVAKILGSSNTASELYDSVKGKYRILMSGKSPIGTAGVTGRLNNTNIVAISLSWDQIHSAFQLASVLSHELAHAKQVVSRGFTASEAAPLLTLRQYAFLRWASEEEAYRAQLSVASEVRSSSSVWGPCVKILLLADPRLMSLAVGDTMQARQHIVDDYSLEKLRSDYLREKAMPISGALPNLLSNYLRSDDWKAAERIWDDFIVSP